MQEAVTKNDILFVEMSLNRYREELEKASTLGAMNALRMCGVPVREFVSRVELSKQFGKGKIDRMIKDGKLIPYRMDGGRSKYKLSDVLLTIN